MSAMNGVVLKNMVYNGMSVKKWNHNGVQVFSAGSTVTYFVDTNKYYVEEVDNGESCLSPTTFTPSKDGWTFVGWRKDTAASGSVESSVIMGTDPIALYAVYKQTVTLSYNGNDSTSGSTASQSNYKYYNAGGNTLDPTFTLAANGFAKTNYTFSGWNLGAVGAPITLSASTVAYAQWVGVPYTWFDNYVASGAALSITVTTDKWNEDLGSFTYITNRFQFHSESPDETSASYCTFSTNAVETRGLRELTINFGSDGWWSGTAGGNFKVISNTGAVLYHVSGEDKSLTGTVTIDVSSASSVYIAGDCGCWAYHGNARAYVYGASFSN